MEPNITFEIIDNILMEFYKIYPDKNSFEVINSSFSKKEVADLQTVLTEHGFLEFTGGEGYYLKYRLTPFGKEFLDRQLSFGDYLTEREKQKAENVELMN